MSWIVDPVEETIEIYRLTESDYEAIDTISNGGELRSAVLPGLAFATAGIFPR